MMEAILQPMVSTYAEAFALCLQMPCQIGYVAGRISLQSLRLASNIKLVDWAPQNSILGHPAVRAFITYSGSNSVYEAAYHGVPIVAVPLRGSQHDMAAKVRW